MDPLPVEVVGLPSALERLGALREQLRSLGSLIAVGEDAVGDDVVGEDTDTELAAATAGASAAGPRDPIAFADGVTWSGLDWRPWVVAAATALAAALYWFGA